METEHPNTRNMDLDTAFNHYSSHEERRYREDVGWDDRHAEDSIPAIVHSFSLRDVNAVPIEGYSYRRWDSCQQVIEMASVNSRLRPFAKRLWNVSPGYRIAISRYLALYMEGGIFIADGVWCRHLDRYVGERGRRLLLIDGGHCAEVKHRLSHPDLQLENLVSASMIGACPEHPFLLAMVERLTEEANRLKDRKVEDVDRALLRHSQHLNAALIETLKNRKRIPFDYQPLSMEVFPPGFALHLSRNDHKIPPESEGSTSIIIVLFLLVIFILFLLGVVER